MDNKFKKNLKISEETHANLTNVKTIMKKRNFDETIQELINFYKENKENSKNEA
ncbi:MAG: hypothetical protein QXS37_01520 [Candidatus Aenigmatarchaeota archaeon]